MARRIEGSIAWLVLEDDGRVVGYAYAATFHPRAAYRWACEVSVYLEQGRRRTGGGPRALRRAPPPPDRARLPGRDRRDDAPQRRQRRAAPQHSASSPSARTATSATSSAPGTTSPGPSARWPAATPCRRSRGDQPRLLSLTSRSRRRQRVGQPLPYPRPRQQCPGRARQRDEVRRRGRAVGGLGLQRRGQDVVPVDELARVGRVRVGDRQRGLTGRAGDERRDEAS